MMKLKTAMIYRLRYQLKSLGIFHLYLILFAIIIPGIVTYVAGGNVSGETDLTIPGFVFALILAQIGIRTDFKFFIQNGMNRLHIFLSNVFSNFVVSNVIAITMLVFYSIFRAFSLNFQNFRLLLLEQYLPKPSILSYILLVVIIFLGATLGVLLGLFLDRFSSANRLVIGAGVIMLPILIFTLIGSLSDHAKNQLLTTLCHILGITDQGLKVVPLVITLLVLIGINTGISYLMNYRRVLKRMS